MMPHNTQYQKDKWRIAIGNINSFPNDLTGPNKYKLDTLRQLITRNNSDIIMMSEHNRNITNLNFQQRPSEIMKTWWPKTIVRSSFLVSSNTNSYEPGGTMIVTNSRSMAHTCQAGQDSHQLGRWNYITLRGRREKYTTIISVYRPNKSQETYMRQIAHSANRCQTRSESAPEELWFQDLQALIVDRKEQGHEIIVAGDFNDDLNDENSSTRKFMHQLGLTEILLAAYGKGPPTHIRGSTTIDGVFATKDVQLVKGKYISFEQSPSDHRWIVIDISEHSIIGAPRNDCTPPMLRKATTKIPSVKNKFHQLVETQVHQHRLLQKVSTLYEMAKSGKPWSNEQKQLYESIESRLQKIVKYADRNCRKVRRGPTPFSPKQKQLMGAILVLQQIKLRHELKGNKNRPRKRRNERLQRKYQYEGATIFTDLGNIQKALTQALTKYDEFKRSAHEQRWSYLESIARELDCQQGKGIRHHFKILQHQEQVKECFRRIKYSEGRQKGRKVDKIQANIDGELQVIYDRQPMETEIMRVNEIKLQQADNTPLRSAQLADLLGEQGDFTKWEQILTGSIKLPDNVDEGLQLWFNYITQVDKHSPMDFHWTTEEYFDSWSKISEDKMASPGIQIAHIKCIDPQSSAAAVISLMALLPFMVEYSLKTWRIGIDSMIPKKTIDLRPEKLRLILLMDARFNHGNKLIGKKMMEYGERHNLLAPEQFGSRKAKSAIDHATNKRFTMDILRQSGTNTIYIANDAKSCYDRIILMVAYLTMRNFGIPPLVAQSTISTIMNMKHHVRTCYGDSIDYYGGDKWTHKPHGCGQGNGYGPALWACISSPLLHILQQEGFGTTLYQPLTQVKIHLSAFAFVDNTDIIQTYNNPLGNTVPLSPDYMEEMFARTQNALNVWAGSLAATGGELEDTKTYYVPILHGWKGTSSVLKPHKDTHRLFLYKADGTRVPLESKQSSESFFTLGIWQSPSGDERQQLQYMSMQIKEWGNKTSTNRIIHKYARIATRSTIGRTLSYPLTATAFDTKQCRQLQKSLLYEVLGKIGIVCTASSLLSTAPVSLGGFRLLSFEVEQLTQHLHLLMLHGPAEGSITGQLLRSTLEYMALETGCSGDPLNLPQVHYITKNTWAAQTIASLWKFNIDIRSDIGGLLPWCQGDVFIMEKLQNLPPATLSVINKVRMHLRVNTLSDMLVADGRAYDRKMLQGIPSDGHPQPSGARYLWPQTATPTPTERQIWTSTICAVFNIDLSSPQRYAETTISWFNDSVTYSRWLFSPMTQLVYEWVSASPTRWHTWAHVPSTHTRYNTRSLSTRYAPHGTAHEIPSEVYPISISKSGNHLTISSRRVISTSAAGVRHIPIPETTTFKAPRTSATNYYLYHITLNNGVIFSDGSYAKGNASHAVLAQPLDHYNCLQDVNFDELIYFSDHLPGQSDNMNSYRAELAGICAAVEMTNDMCASSGITTGQCTLYCDSKGALHAAFGNKRPTPRWSLFDLVAKIRTALRHSPIKWRYCHVKGHQDSKQPFSRLDYAAKGNAIVDHLASTKRRESRDNVGNDKGLWVPSINGQDICGELPNRAKNIIFRPQMISFWQNTLGISNQHVPGCEWDLFFRSISAHAAPNINHSVIKYNARILPVGRNLLRRKHSLSSSCPGCGIEEEDHDHLILCSHDDMVQTYQQEVDALAEWLSHSTTRDLRLSILFLLQNYRLAPSDTVPPFPTAMAAVQYELGSRAFFAGVWHQSWLHHQDAYHHRIKTRRSASTWLIQLIQKVQTIPIRLWHTRNNLLHKTEGNAQIQALHRDLDTIIKSIFSKKPHPRLMSHWDNSYFQKHDIHSVKNMKLRRKINWVAGANLILTKYERTTSVQSARFRSYFQWDDNG
jgi:exonuclease III